MAIFKILAVEDSATAEMSAGTLDRYLIYSPYWLPLITT